MAILPIFSERQRAQQRGAAADFDIGTVSETYLGDPAVVEGLVRKLAGDVAAARGDYNEGKISHIAAAGRVNALAAALAPAFIGASPDYQAMPSWNAPDGGIIPYLRSRGFVDKTAVDVVEACLLNFAGRILQGMIEHEENGDDEAGKFAVDSAVEDVVADLLGLPADAEAREGAAPAVVN